MVFIDYMNSLRDVRSEEVKKIAELTSTTRSTVYRWISGEINPPSLKKKIIADFYGKPINELFPDNDTK